MPNPYWENLKGIFEAALALAPDERAAYLDRVCDGNDSLRQAVQYRSTLRMAVDDEPTIGEESWVKPAL